MDSLIEWWWRTSDLVRERWRRAVVPVGILLGTVGIIVALVVVAQPTPTPTTAGRPRSGLSASCRAALASVTDFVAAHPVKDGPLSAQARQVYAGRVSSADARCPSSAISSLNSRVIDPWQSVLAQP